MTTVYSYEEALCASEAYFNGDELAAKVFVDKYALRNENNQLLEDTPEAMHWRLAREFYRIEKKKYTREKGEIDNLTDFGKYKYSRPLSLNFIFSLLDRYKYIVPQGSPMAGIGDKNRYITLSNCYVVDLHDSYSGICRTDEYIANISKRRGGIGFDLSCLRPRSVNVSNCARTTTGSVSFMERFSNTGREVGQNNRRAAIMLTMSVHHPDILEFVNIKRDLKKVTGANISVRLSDEFLNAVKKNEEYELRWPVESKTPEISRRISAKEIWDQIIDSAWSMAEPGLLFWDNILKESPADCYMDFGFGTVATNPCSELPLSAFDSCRLLFLNLVSYVKNPFTSEAYFDLELFNQHSQIAQRLMDNVVDLELECIDRILDKIEQDKEPEHIKLSEKYLWTKIKESCINGRRTGTGISGLGDTLAYLNIKYGSEKSIDIGAKIYKCLKYGAYKASIDMAGEIGSFPVFDEKLEKDNLFLGRLDEEFGLSGPRRNIALLTIAPVGTASTQTQTTSGIEPAFMLEYTRRKKINHDDKHSRVDFVDNVGDKWQEFTVYHHGLKKWMDVTGETDISKSPYYGATANEIDWINRVKLQAAIQKHCDHSISSTINLPEDVSKEVVAQIYQTAWKSGCKGMTVYRNNCRSGVLVEKKDKICVAQNALDRPKEIPCDIFRVSTRGNKFTVLVGLLNNLPYEVFCMTNHLPGNHSSGILKKVKRGKYQLIIDGNIAVEDVNVFCSDESEVECRLTSMSLRHQVPLQYIVQQLEKCISTDMFAFNKVLGRTLKKYIPDGTKVSGEDCPKCQTASLIREEGCVKCASCGWAKCS